MKDTKHPLAAKVTIRTVAADAGVSVAAVSKVLRNAYGVSTTLRDKVQASIERLGYRPSKAARAMRGQTYMIGILLVEMENPFLAPVINSINAVLAPSNYKALIGVGHATTHIESSLIESMLDSRMDGLILIAPRISGATLAKYARQAPMVVIGHHEATAQAYDTVNSDDLEGAQLAVRALIDAGHRRIHMVSLTHLRESGIDVYERREDGYRQAMLDAGLSEHIEIVKSDINSESIAADMRAILQNENRPSAYFCWSDLHAIPLLNEAKQMGLRVPQDLAIVGYDNSPVAALPLINLASIDQSTQVLGEFAANYLLSRIKGRSVSQHMLVAPTLMRRDSI